MKAFLTDTVLRGQLYKRPLSQIPVLLKSHTNSVFLTRAYHELLQVQGYANESLAHSLVDVLRN